MAVLQATGMLVAGRMVTSMVKEPILGEMVMLCTRFPCPLAIQQYTRKQHLLVMQC